ncbi:DUF6414 family protein [Alkalicoccobacillus gibsonii]|uniref:DUF6414 family protein n=1 Tax=Alkalicoccobacillus gibsonii TaxID=79881 RepID=UPI003517D66F
MKKLKHFSVYYLNFDKVFEIAMLLDNKVLKTQEENSEKKHSINVTARVQAMLSAIFKAEGEASYDYSKASGIKKTVEIKSTNSVILRDLIDQIQQDDNDNFEEGKLIIARDLNLKVANEEEMRPMMLIKQGLLDKFTQDDIPIGDVMKTLSSDYHYALTTTNVEENFLIKIPSEVENEFENNYTIDDLTMGKVSLIGIYKGKKRIHDLKSTFSYLQETETKEQSDFIQSSNSPEQGAGKGKEKDKTEYHFLDILAIIQELRLGT